jgi:predicted ferric reductase
MNADEFNSTLDWKVIAGLFLAVIAGALAAVFVVPQWLPGLAGSLFGDAPKAYWYLSRASALVAYGLLWLSMLLGLSITNKLARLWPGGPVAFDLHEYASWLGLAFALFHALILMGDHYINYSLVQVFMPFASTGYKPVWVGLGQLGFYLMALVTLSFYVRKQIGAKTWRLIHYASFAMFLLALIHGLLSGTDTSVPAVVGMYWLTGGSFLFLLVYRILVVTLFKTTRASSAG